MIPNIFHFIFGLKEDFGGKPFNLSHYIAIKSAIEINHPDKVYFYCTYEPVNEWFEKLRNHIEIIKVDPPTNIFGNKLYHVAHQADVIRLEMLKEKGGIYMDIDTICVKPFTDLLDNEFVIGEQLAPDYKSIQGLCNAVILSEPNSEFVNIWYDSYKDFRAEPLTDDINSGGGENYLYWDEHSVYKPKYLSMVHRNKLHIVNFKSFHYPIWDQKGMKLLFEEDNTFDEAYCHHLWESISWVYLNNITLEDIQLKDTTYNKIARRFL